MSDNVQIALIIAITVVIILFLFRRQLSRFFLKAGREGVEAELETRENSPQTGTANPVGVKISDNKQIGAKNKIEVGQTSVAVEDNLQLGQKQQIVAKPESSSDEQKA